MFEEKKNKGQLKSLLKELAVSGLRLEIPLNLNLYSRQINKLDLVVFVSLGARGSSNLALG